MKFLKASLFILSVLISGSGLAQPAASSGADQPVSSNSAVLQEETPAQQSISAATAADQGGSEEGAGLQRVGDRLSYGEPARLPIPAT